MNVFVYHQIFTIWFVYCIFVFTIHKKICDLLTIHKQAYEHAGEKGLMQHFFPDVDGVSV